MRKLIFIYIYIRVYVCLEEGIACSSCMPLLMSAFLTGCSLNVTAW